MYPRILTDGLARSISIAAPPQRIVCLVPSLTEWLFDLGLEDRVVGVTKFCVRPKHWRRTKAVVGGTKNIHLERLFSLSPDLVIANREENDRETVEQIMRTIPVYTSDVRDFNMAMAALQDIAYLCSREAHGSALIQSIQAQCNQPIIKKRSSCLYLIWKEPLMTVSQDTFIHDMLRRSGFDPISVAAAGRYPTITPEVALTLRPEFVMLSSEPYPFEERHREEMQTWFPDAKVVLVNGETFSWYGSRMLFFDGWKYHGAVDNSRDMSSSCASVE
ncbi:MAG: ABC transporter substrate-binding protein [Flavobacteriales bacterium]